MLTATEILDMLNASDEDIRIESKTGSDVDRSILETICAYSNEPGLDGGYIILGTHRENDEKNGSFIYNMCGVDDPDKIQMDLSSKCATTFNFPVRPMIKVEQKDGKNVIVVRVEELPARQKPVFFKNEGLPKGAYRRIGSTDQRCMEDDMYIFYSSHDELDNTVIKDTTMDDIDDNAVTRYRQLREKVNPAAEELAYNDVELLTALGACKKDENGIIRLTYTGLLVFGTALSQRRIMPAIRIDYVRVPGNMWMENVDRRFYTIDMRGPMILTINRIFNTITDDLPHGFILHEGNLQAERGIGLSDKVLREALVNAFIHRSFRVNSPIQVIRYNNRIEIINPGFSLKSEESLGEPGSVLRNPFISAIFHETNLAETKDSGIRTMRRLMEQAGMIPPTFESDHSRNQFTTRLLLHHLLEEKDIRWLKSLPSFENINDRQRIALIFVREIGAVDNVTYRQLNNSSAAETTADLKGLCRFGLLSPKGKGKATYYVPGEKLPLPEKNKTYPAREETYPAREALFYGLPDELKDKIMTVGKKTGTDEMTSIILELCTYSEFGIADLAKLLKRNEKYIKTTFIKPLRAQKKLFFTIPEMPNHPGQKYTTAEPTTKG